MRNEANNDRPVSGGAETATVETGESIRIRQADLENSEDTRSVLRLLDNYALHPMGSGAPLPDRVRKRVIDGLRAHPTTLVFLAFSGTQAVGLANCFVGYSTFQAKPIVNIHDLCVQDAFRGRGVGGRLIDAVIAHATDHDWCAVTLEVRADNPARQLYARKGFQGLKGSVDGPVMLFGKLTIDTEAR